MQRAQGWTVPRIAMLAVAVAIGCELNAIVTGGSAALSAVALSLSLVALVLFIAWDALGYLR
jgi:hypothetical protein